MFSLSVLICFLPLALISRAQTQCSSKIPLSLPISNVSISDGIIRRGFGIRVGTPAQDLAVAVNADWNNTFLYTADGKCSDTTTAQCTFDRGGAFEQTQSSTFSPLSSADGAEFRAADKGSLSVVALGDDLFDLTPSANIKAFPFFTPPSGQLPQSGCGLGRNSTLLSYLFAAGTIPSRTWSLFWGLEGGTPSSQMSGSLTFGGYDAAKITGPNMTEPLSSFEDMIQCPSSMLVNIADVSITFKNGTSTSLFAQAGQTSMRSCIKPDIPLITFPGPVWNAFQQSVGGTYLAPSESYKLWGMDYAAAGIFDGEMTFTFASGLQVTVPNEQLVVPDVQADTSGKLTSPNATVREILVYNYEDSNANDMPLLGQAFLTSAYLHVDNDREQFTLWQANPTKSEHLVPVCHDVDTDSSPSSPHPSQTPSVASSHHTTSRQIAKYVLSACLAAGVSTLAGWLLYRWHARRRATAAAQQSLVNGEFKLADEMGGQHYINSKTLQFGKAELPSHAVTVGEYIKSELPGHGVVEHPNPRLISEMGGPVRQETKHAFYELSAECVHEMDGEQSPSEQRPPPPLK